MDIVKFFEIFTFVTGIIYVVLEIKQHNFMWVIGLFTASAAVISFYFQNLYASMGLNIYYVVISIVGFYRWRTDSKKLSEISQFNAEVQKENETIHLSVLKNKTIILSLLFIIVGTILLRDILNYLNDPMGLLDAYVTMLSIVATYWLTKSYVAQWLIWVVADMLAAYLCFSQSLNWMAILYIIYSLTAIYGFIYWKIKGVYVDN